MIVAIAMVHLAVVVSPGANFLVVSRNALAYSRQTGLLTARGVALGTLTYVTIGLLGFATIIATSPLLFNLIKLVGSVYFFYVGGKTLYGLRKPRHSRDGDETTKVLSRRGAFFSGLVTALSNPTAALYFLSLFTTFVQTAAPAGEKALTGLMWIGLGLKLLTTAGT